MPKHILATVIALLMAAGLPAGQTTATAVESRVDAVFARWTATTPGCAVGVGVGGKPVLARAYGMADLEHDVPNKPDTISKPAR